MGISTPIVTPTVSPVKRDETIVPTATIESDREIRLAQAEQRRAMQDAIREQATR